jgi:hypothetical protein
VPTEKSEAPAATTTPATTPAKPTKTTPRKPAHAKKHARVVTPRAG